MIDVCASLTILVADLVCAKVAYAIRAVFIENLLAGCTLWVVGAKCY